MLEPKARWNLNIAEEAKVQELSSALGIDPLVARLLVLRNIHSVQEAQIFLNGGKGNFNDPYLLDGVHTAVVRIRQALERGEKIRIYGDYDADGVSSTALMTHLLQGLDANFDTYIPHRVREGYGLNRNAIDLAKDQGVSLLITVDTGISAVDEVRYIKELGMDVIVTDHHEPPAVLPDALAVINPKKPGCPYPFKQLAGVGVAFKLAQAVLNRLPEELLEFAAIGTVADLMPLIDENRLIVKLGLERMQTSDYIGIRALLGVSGIERKAITSGHIGFALAPRINASGRLECADDAVRLLTTDNGQEAEQIAFELDELNKERQRIVEDITKEAMELAELQCAAGMDKVIVVAQEGWNIGVIGIVASKLVEKYYRPTIVLCVDNDKGVVKGSARSIAGFDMYKALVECEEWLEHYGGHQAAAGMTLKKDSIAAFRGKLNALASEWMSEEDFIPVLRADLECRLHDISLKLIEQLDKLAPFGMGNPSPKFVFKELKLEDIRTMGREKQHLKLSLSQSVDASDYSIEAVAFGKGRMADMITPTAQLNVLGEVSINEWNGVRKPQITVQDFSVPHLQVFDWRGTAKPEARLTSLVDYLESGRDGIPPAILLFSEAAVHALKRTSPRTYEKCPVWLWDVSDLDQPVNAEALHYDYWAMKDIILYSVPLTLGVLEQALCQAAGMRRCYAIFSESESAGGGVPSRDMFKLLYGFLQQQGGWSMNNPRLLNAFSKRSGLSAAMIEFMLGVFEELGFTERVGQEYKPNPSPVRKDLAASRLYQQRIHRMEVEQVTIYSSTKELEQWIIEAINNTKQIWEEIV